MWHDFKLILFIVGLIISGYNLITLWKKEKRIDYSNVLFFILFASLIISKMYKL